MAVQIYRTRSSERQARIHCDNVKDGRRDGCRESAGQQDGTDRDHQHSLDSALGTENCGKAPMPARRAVDIDSDLAWEDRGRSTKKFENQWSSTIS